MDELEARIAARLHEALDRQVAGGFYFEPPAVADPRGMATEEPGAEGEGLVLRLSVEDVARIAATEARRELGGPAPDDVRVAP